MKLNISDIQMIEAGGINILITAAGRINDPWGALEVIWWGSERDSRDLAKLSAPVKHPSFSLNHQSAASTSSQCSATFTFGQTFLIFPSGPIKNVTRAVPR